MRDEIESKLVHVVLLKNKFNNIIILLCMSSLRLAVIEKKRNACGACDVHLCASPNVTSNFSSHSTFIPTNLLSAAAAK